MKCQKCNEKEATIQIVQKHIGGKEESLALCAACAKELGISFSSVTHAQEAIPLSIFNDFFQQHFDLEHIGKKENTCPSCQMTLDMVRKKGLLGCPQCYDAFSEYLEPIFGKMQMGKEHKGRMLGKIEKEEESAVSVGIRKEEKLLKKEESDDVRKVKEKEALLKKAIEKEDYILAAKIRDELRVIREKK